MFFNYNLKRNPIIVLVQNININNPNIVNLNIWNITTTHYERLKHKKYGKLIGGMNQTRSYERKALEGKDR